VLGCFGAEPKNYVMHAEGGQVAVTGSEALMVTATADAPAAILELARERLQAKRAKDWVRADRLRAEIAAAGWKIVDTPAGARLEKA